MANNQMNTTMDSAGPSDSTTGQNPLTEALRQRRIKKAQNHRIVPTNDQDDEQGDLVEKGEQGG